MKMLSLFFLITVLLSACEKPDPVAAMEEAYEQEAIETGERELQEWEAAQPFLKAVKMNTSRRSKSGAVIIEVTNRGTVAFWGINFRYTARDPNREFPYEIKEGLAFIDGGVEPGETKTLMCGFKPQEPYPTPATIKWEIISLVRDQASEFRPIADGTMKEEDREAALARRKRLSTKH